MNRSGNWGQTRMPLGIENYEGHLIFFEVADDTYSGLRYLMLMVQSCRYRLGTTD